MNKKVVVPVSGGADSAVLLFEAAETCESVSALIFDYGQRHSREIEFAEELCRIANRRYKNVTWTKVDARFIRVLAPTSSLTNDSIDTPNVKKVAGEAQPASYVAFRNAMFLSIALSHAEAINATEVWHGATAVDSLAGYWDGTQEFIDRLNGVSTLNREHQIKVVAPLIKSDKKDIVLRGVNVGVPFDKTYTCYSGEELADADTPSSSLRLRGFIEAGYIDPVRYKQQEAIDKIYKKNGCRQLPTSVD